MAPTPVRDLEDLRQRVVAGQHQYAIVLADGLAYSRKTILLKGRGWLIRNHIDDTRQMLTDAQLWTESNIGKAIDNAALVEMTDSRIGGSQEA